MEKLLLKPMELAEQLGVSRSRAYELLRDGTLPSIQVGGTRTRRVPVQAVRAWIKRRVAGKGK